MADDIDLPQFFHTFLQRPIAFHRVFATVAGGALPGLFLSQAWYWAEKTQDADGWFYKTQAEWTDETALSRKEQETARKHLRMVGVLEEKKQGIPAKLYYRINEKTLQTRMYETGILVSTKRADRDVRNGHPINKDARVRTETTTETTKKEDLDKNLSLAGGETMLTPSPPLSPKKPRTALKKKPLGAEDWIAVWLRQQDVVPFAYLNDERWWTAASRLVTDGFDEAWLEHEFALIVLFFQKPGERAPTTEAGWKRFLTHWFQLADKKEQREKRQEQRYGTPRQTR